MPIPLREDFDAGQLRSEARKSKDSGQARRLLALAAIYDGSTRTQAAKIGGVTPHTQSRGSARARVRACHSHGSVPSHENGYQAAGAIEDFKNVWPAPFARGLC